MAHQTHAVSNASGTLHTVGKTFKLWLSATRPAFLSVTFVGVLIGLATASYSGAFHSLWLATLTLIFALVAHAGANVLNDYYDALSGCDAANTDRIFPFTGGSRFIQDGLLTTKQTAIFGYALLIAVIPAGLYLIAESGAGLLFIGMCGLFAGWAYSAKPLALQSRGVGEITITIAWMLIVIGSDYVQRGSFSLTPIISGIAYALLVANVLFINQIPDINADAISGKRTVIVRFGSGVAQLGSALLYLGATATIFIGIAVGALPINSAFGLLFWAPAALALYTLCHIPMDKTSLTLTIRLTIISTLLAGFLLTLSLLFAAET